MRTFFVLYFQAILFTNKNIITTSNNVKPKKILKKLYQAYKDEHFVKISSLF